MRIDKIQLGLGLLAALVFGLLAFEHLFVDAPVIATQHINQKIKDAQKDTSEYRGYKRAEIALAEYNKNVTETVRGCNCGPEIDKYNEDSPVQWCTTFASWVAREAGSPVVDPVTGSQKIINSKVFAEYLKQSGTFYSREEVVAQDIQPRIGDFIISYRGDYEDNIGHIDIVVGDSKDGRADLVGGNIRDRIAYRKDFPYRDYHGFLGIARPEK